ncbi:MAG: hypothetical protein WBX81_17390, partial [Nitrososphaeraceae archaeon]
MRIPKLSSKYFIRLSSSTIHCAENGPGHSDEINLVEPGFNSGWNQVMGIWTRGGGDPREGESTLASEQPEGLVTFGRGQYHSPQLTWLYTIGTTAIKFLNSDKYGVE